MVILSQMIILYLVMFVGLLIRKVGLVSTDASKVMSNLVINVTNPALVIASALENQRAQTDYAMLMQVFILGILYYGVMLIFAEILPRILRAREENKGVYKTMTVFSNNGFMGYPLIAAMQGTGAVLYASVFALPFNFLIYTYGIMSMKGRGEAAGKKRNFREKMVYFAKSGFNIGTLSSLLAVILLLAKIPLPMEVESACNMLGNITAPLSMLVIGTSLAEMKMTELAKDYRLIFFSGFKLLLIPFAGLFLLGLCDFHPIVMATFFINIATPVASMTAMLARQYDANYDLAAKGVALTTLLSVGTIPLCSLLFL